MIVDLPDNTSIWCESKEIRKYEVLIRDEKIQTGDMINVRESIHSNGVPAIVISAESAGYALKMHRSREYHHLEVGDEFVCIFRCDGLLLSETLYPATLVSYGGGPNNDDNYFEFLLPSLPNDIVCDCDEVITVMTSNSESLTTKWFKLYNVSKVIYECC